MSFYWGWKTNCATSVQWKGMRSRCMWQHTQASETSCWMKGARPQILNLTRLCLYDIYVIFLPRKTIGTENTWVGWDEGWAEGLWGNSGKDGALLCLHSGGGCTNLHICQNSLSYTHRVNVTPCKSYLNFKTMKPELESVLEQTVWMAVTPHL